VGGGTTTTANNETQFINGPATGNTFAFNGTTSSAIAGAPSVSSITTALQSIPTLFQAQSSRVDVLNLGGAGGTAANAPTGGTFTISFNGTVSTPITVTGADIHTAIQNAINAIVPAGATVTVAELGGVATAYNISFGGTFANTNVTTPLIVSYVSTTTGAITLTG